VKTQDAIKLSREAELDLVEVAATASPPVCRIMDYSRFKYDQEKKEKEARKKQKIVHIKEIKFHPNIEKHDYETKLRNLQRFLKRGDKAKVSMSFRGRERAHVSKGRLILEKVAADLAPIASIEKTSPMERYTLVMILMPK